MAGAGRVTLEPALGPELAGVGPPARIVVEQPGRHDRDASRLQRPSGQLVIDDGLAADRPGGRTKPHRLGQDRSGVRKSIEVGDGGRPVREHAVELLVKAGLRLVVPGQEPPRPGERRRRRLVAGEEQRHGLVPYLLVAHAHAFFLCREQKREQIVSSVSCGAASATTPAVRSAARRKRRVDGMGRRSVIGSHGEN